MKTYYVYELINLYGTVEYVGETIRPNIRMKEHINSKPEFGNGKFYGRQDLVMNIVSVFDDRKKALELEEKLKKDYGMEITERTRGIKGGNKVRESGQIYNITKLSVEKTKKTILQYSKSGKFIKKWVSVRDVGRKLNINVGNLSQCALGNRQSAGGYVWKYENN
jgi:predicted GIY-YIG superfamily endonuclease